MTRLTSWLYGKTHRSLEDTQAEVALEKDKVLVFRSAEKVVEATKVLQGMTEELRRELDVRRSAN